MEGPRLRKLTKQWSQFHYDRYIAQQVRQMTRARAAGHRDFRTWTDAEITQAAHDLARMNEVGIIYV